jgi:hypothetical protein
MTGKGGKMYERCSILKNVETRTSGGTSPVDSLVRCVPSTFRVSVQKMVESGDRVTWWVCLDRGDRPLDAKPWDKGRITPYMTPTKEHADFTAKEFADFLGVEVSI